jgi:hypothetical protein
MNCEQGWVAQLYRVADLSCCVDVGLKYGFLERVWYINI